MEKVGVSMFAIFINVIIIIITITIIIIIYLVDGECGSVNV